MSGGSYSYIYSKLLSECEGSMYDDEMNELITDIAEVLHDLEWWQSCDKTEEAYRKTVHKFKEKWLKSKWIPIVERPLTDEEREEYEEDIVFMFDCPLPDDCQEVLITDRSGRVEVDTFCHDEYCYFECNCDIGDVLAWKPMPEPYKRGAEE